MLISITIEKLQNEPVVPLTVALQPLVAVVYSPGCAVPNHAKCDRLEPTSGRSAMHSKEVRFAPVTAYLRLPTLCPGRHGC
jgi:hypothetical protein